MLGAVLGAPTLLLLSPSSRENWKSEGLNWLLVLVQLGSLLKPRQFGDHWAPTSQEKCWCVWLFGELSVGLSCCIQNWGKVREPRFPISRLLFQLKRQSPGISQRGLAAQIHCISIISPLKSDSFSATHQLHCSFCVVPSWTLKPGRQSQTSSFKDKRKAKSSQHPVSMVTACRESTQSCRQWTL